MHKSSVVYNFLYILLLSPLLSYLTFGVLGLRPLDYYIIIFINIYGIFFFFSKSKNIKIPYYAVFALLWVIYLFIWTFYTGEFGRRGLIAVLLSNTNLAIFFVLVIIQNTQFSARFITNSIRIIKITVILTAAVSIIQVIDSSFMSAWPLWARESERIFLEGDIHTYRRASIYGFIERNALGLSFIPLVSVLTGYLIYNRSKLIAVFLVAGAIVAFLSNTRYVMVAFLLLTIQLLTAYKIRSVGTIRYAILITLVLILSFQTINYLGYDMADWADERLFREGSIQETTRFKAIANFSYFFPQYPIFGNGSLSDEDVIAASRAIGSSHIHVGYLSHLVAFGVVGCFFLYGFWFLLVKKLYRNAKRTNYWGSFFAFLTFLWAFATFSQSSIFYYGLIFALVFDKYFIDKHNSQYSSARYKIEKAGTEKSLA